MIDSECETPRELMELSVRYDRVLYHFLGSISSRVKLPQCIKVKAVKINNEILPLRYKGGIGFAN